MCVFHLCMVHLHVLPKTILCPSPHAVAVEMRCLNSGVRPSERKGGEKRGGGDQGSHLQKRIEY